MSFQKFQEIYSQVPRLSVDLIIQSPEGILLTMRDIEPYKGFWHTPGGTVYFREGIKDAVKRKAKEEVGADIEIVRNLGYIEFLDGESYGGFRDYVVSLVFLCKLLSSDIKLDEQSSDYKFFKEIPENTIPEIKRFLGQRGFDSPDLSRTKT